VGATTPTAQPAPRGGWAGAPADPAPTARAWAAAHPPEATDDPDRARARAHWARVGAPAPTDPAP